MNGSVNERSVESERGGERDSNLRKCSRYSVEPLLTNKLGDRKIFGRTGIHPKFNSVVMISLYHTNIPQSH